MTEKTALLAAAGILAIMVVTGTITIAQALEFLRSLVQIVSALADVTAAS